MLSVQPVSVASTLLYGIIHLSSILSPPFPSLLPRFHSGLPKLTLSVFFLSARFDEVHFGKFAGKYIKTRYFVDVHPPLAKLLITLAAFVFGFNGDFDFKDIAKLVTVHEELVLSLILSPHNSQSLRRHALRRYANGPRHTRNRHHPPRLPHPPRSRLSSHNRPPRLHAHNLRKWHDHPIPTHPP